MNPGVQRWAHNEVTKLQTIVFKKCEEIESREREMGGSKYKEFEKYKKLF